MRSSLMESGPPLKEALHPRHGQAFEDLGAHQSALPNAESPGLLDARATAPSTLQGIYHPS